MEVIDEPTHRRPVQSGAAEIVSMKGNGPAPRCDAQAIGRVNLRIQLQAMDAMADVLVTVLRLGGTIESIAGADERLELVASARASVSRRMPGLIDQLIGVLDVDVLEPSTC